MEQPKSMSCPKCGSLIDVEKMRRKGDHACPYCQEPLQALIALDRWNWGESDFKEKGV